MTEASLSTNLTEMQRVHYGHYIAFFRGMRIFVQDLKDKNALPYHKTQQVFDDILSSILTENRVATLEGNAGLGGLYWVLHEKERLLLACSKIPSTGPANDIAHFYSWLMRHFSANAELRGFVSAFGQQMNYLSLARTIHRLERGAPLSDEETSEYLPLKDQQTYKWGNERTKEWIVKDLISELVRCQCQVLRNLDDVDERWVKSIASTHYPRATRLCQFPYKAELLIFILFIGCVMSVWATRCCPSRRL